MRDEALATAPALSKAEAAVNYILKRMRVDADLRWHMLGTEAFARLCIAEAERTGMTEDEIGAMYSTPADHCASDRPKLLELRAVVREALDRLPDENPMTKEMIQKLERLS